MGSALVLIGGSTASGKSALALDVARRIGAVIVNADSQQLFADLPILTARPGPAEEAQAPHRLYGVLEAEAQPSVGRWLALLGPILEQATREARTLVVVGGTGLYLHALLHGLPPLPSVPPELRRRLAAENEGTATAALHAKLAEHDPAMAARLRPSDRQRVLRALEVVMATGRSLAEWQAAPPVRTALPERRAAIALVPPAALVAERAAARLDLMIQAGAIQEVAALAQRRADLAALPIAKVHGVRDMLAFTAGDVTDAAMRAGIATQVRQYAKRQRTFLRHQLPELEPVESLPDERLALDLVRRLG